MRRLLAATSSAHKLREMRRLFPRHEVVGFDDLRVDGDDPESWPEPPSGVVESGSTFAANALIKALAASRCCEWPVLADDSGLCVDAVGGAPGVLSARHGGPGLDDAGRWRLLLDQMQGVPVARRTARYRAVLVVAEAGRLVGAAEGQCEGRILETPRGDGGFGYDPIVLVPPFGRSMAELSPDEKDAVSHRARAARRLAHVLA